RDDQSGPASRGAVVDAHQGGRSHRRRTGHAARCARGAQCSLDGRIVAAGGAVLSSVLLSLVGVVPDLALTNRDQSWLRGRSTRRLDHCLPLGSGCPDGSGGYTPKG
ncbi:MAG: hypothetical protein LC799_25510, partial [Actinobacteria bacterium]|nr:hypothetical protein [Actinomycetota bacterium]